MMLDLGGVSQPVLRLPQSSLLPQFSLRRSDVSFSKREIIAEMNGVQDEERALLKQPKIFC